MRVPEFLVRQFYVRGSLRRDGDGFCLQARNGLGDGTLVGVGRISVDGIAVDPSSITATRDGEDQVRRATDVSRAAPVSFKRGDTVTFRVRGHSLTPGEHAFEVEIFELNLGRVLLALRDTVAEAT